MTSESFLHDRSVEVFNIIEMTKKRFQLLDPAITSQKPSEGQWSVIECFEHLNLTLDIYLPQLEKIVQNPKAYPTREKHFKYSLLGKLAVNAMRPKSKGKVPFKMKTFGKLKPVEEKLSHTSIIDRFLKHQDTTILIIKGFNGLSLMKPKVKTAAGSLIKLPAGDALHFMIAHNQRHLAQAENTLKIIS
jgi:hypothetical protein